MLTKLTYIGTVCTLNISVTYFSLQNYNKSRIHSARGARLVEMTLDQRTIFHGEIARGDNCEVSRSIGGVNCIGYPCIQTQEEESDIYILLLHEQCIVCWALVYQMLT